MRIRTKNTLQAFTLTEIMIVVAIIGLLAVMVIPRAMRAREQACLQTIRANLRVIEDSKQQWAMAQRVGNGSVPSATQLVGYFKGDELPNAVAGETYNINAVGVLASATLTGGLLDLPAGAEVVLE